MSIGPNTAHRAIALHFLPRWSPAALLMAAIAAAGIPGSRATAEDGIVTWIVKLVSPAEEGDIIPVSTMQAPQAGAALTTGQQISTSAGQRIVLVNGRDLVELSPNTTIAIGDNNPATADANVDVVSGTIHVEVGKRTPGQTFSIGAPYLLATVKGTRFDVSTSSNASAVSVTEGVVAVSSVASGDSIDVTAGETAIVGNRTLGAPSLAPTPAGGASSITGFDSTLDSTSPNAGGSGTSGGSVGGAAHDAAGAVGDAADAADGVSGAVGDAAGAAGDAVSGASGAVGGAVSGATGAVGGAVSDATGAVGGTVGGAVGGAVSGVGGAVGGAVSGVGGAVGGAVGGVGGALGGAIGGLGGKR